MKKKILDAKKQQSFSCKIYIIKFAHFLLTVQKETPGFSFGMRGLATTHSFVECHKKHPEVIAAMHEAGLHTVGFGIDGTPAVWERIKKKHNKVENNELAVRLCTKYGIKPEVLMIVGQPQETPEELEAALCVTKQLVDEHDAASRPHVFKPLPGSREWSDVTRSKIMDLLLQDPEAFTAFDVLAEASPVSHPDEERRTLVNAYFERYLALPSNRTAAVHPVGWWLTLEERVENERRNVGVRDR